MDDSDGMKILDARHTMRPPPFTNENLSNLLTHLRLLLSSFSEKSLQDYAFSLVPLTDIRTRVVRRYGYLSLGHVANQTKLYAYRLIFLEELTSWFRNDFFRWMEVPVCSVCENTMTFFRDVDSARLTITTIAEVFFCRFCDRYEFLNRFVNPRILLVTREGRCSEFALCFTLICMALRLKCRYVYDLSDHCWCEVYSPELKKWIHVDPAEGVVNRPLTYELGWGKNLTYIFAVSCEDIQDVTWRYTSNHLLVLLRRDCGQTQFIVDEIIRQREILLHGLTEIQRMAALEFVLSELVQMLIAPLPRGFYEERAIRGESNNSTS